MKANTLVYIDKGHSASIANAVFIFESTISNFSKVFGCSLNLNTLKVGQEPMVVDYEQPGSLKDFFIKERSDLFVG